MPGAGGAWQGDIDRIDSAHRSEDTKTSPARGEISRGEHALEASSVQIRPNR